MLEHCEEDSRLPYAKWYYCSVAPAGMFARLMYMAALMMILPLLFNLLADTAELYFCPTTAILSQSIPKMRPRFAGVTFVAMGNGAPDLSANISAIRRAAMFVQCVVASEVIRISGGVNCRGATLRDVGIYGVSILGVMLTFWSGKVTHWFVAGAIVVYVGYVVWVFCGDEWHERGRPQPAIDLSWRMIKNALAAARGAGVKDEDEQQYGEGLLPWATVDVSAKPAEDQPLLSDAVTGHAEEGSVPSERAQHETVEHAARHQSHKAHLVGARLYQQAVWADLGNEPSLMLDSGPRAHRHGHGHGHARSHAQGPTQGHGSHAGGHVVELHDRVAPTSSSYVPPTLTEGQDAHPSSVTEEQEGRDTLIPFSQDDLDSPVSPRSPTKQYFDDQAAADDHRSPRQADPGQHSTTHTASRGVESSSLSWWHGGEPDWRSLWAAIRRELTVGAADEWEELPRIFQRWRSITFPLLSPVYALLRMTVPFSDPEGYNQPWMVTTMLFSPLAVCLYLGATSLLALGSSVFSFGPALFSLMGFFMGVLWIDALASEVVGVLTLLATLLHVPSSLMGLTLLAWGGSLGDLFGNTALARRGHASTALTACFAGPLFNILISMALGFSALFAREGISSAHVVLTPDVAVGCIFLIAYNIILAVVGWLNNWRLPKQFYYFSRVWYGLYIILASGFGLAELWS
eukprot:gene16197-22361_t